MSWRQFVMDLNELEPGLVESILSRHGALAITLSDAGDDPVLEPAPGEMPLWRDTKISALFDASQNLDALLEDLRESIAPKELPQPIVETLEDRHWEREWLKDFKPMRFGERLWVCPHDMAAVIPPEATIVRLDPGLAFGTGTHPTTALCLRYLDAARLDGCSILDFGSGSGILSIAALKLGAASATAVDIDKQARDATAANAEANDVDSRLRLGLQPRDRFDVIVANILAQPLIDHSGELTQRLKPGGRLAMSGILAEQADSVVAAYAELIDFAPIEYSGDWALVSGVKRSASRVST